MDWLGELPDFKKALLCYSSLAFFRRGEGSYSKEYFVCFGLDIFKEMEKGDKNPDTLRNFSLFKIGYKIVHQNCPKKPFCNITILQKAAPNPSHPLLMCQVGLIERLLSKINFFLTYFFGSVRICVVRELKFLSVFFPVTLRPKTNCSPLAGFLFFQTFWWRSSSGIYVCSLFKAFHTCDSV